MSSGGVETGRRCRATTRSRINVSRNRYSPPSSSLSPGRPSSPDLTSVAARSAQEKTSWSSRDRHSIRPVSVQLARGLPVEPVTGSSAPLMESPVPVTATSTLNTDEAILPTRRANRKRRSSRPPSPDNSSKALRSSRGEMHMQNRRGELRRGRRQHVVSGEDVVLDLSNTTLTPPPSRPSSRRGARHRLMPPQPEIIDVDAEDSSPLGSPSSSEPVSQEHARSGPRSLRTSTHIFEGTARAGRHGASVEEVVGGRVGSGPTKGVTARGAGTGFDMEGAYPRPRSRGARGSAHMSPVQQDQDYQRCQQQQLEDERMAQGLQREEDELAEMMTITANSPPVPFELMGAVAPSPGSVHHNFITAASGSAVDLNSGGDFRVRGSFVPYPLPNLSLGQGSSRRRGEEQITGVANRQAVRGEGSGSSPREGRFNGTVGQSTEGGGGAYFHAGRGRTRRSGTTGQAAGASGQGSNSHRSSSEHIYMQQVLVSLALGMGAHNHHVLEIVGGRQGRLNAATSAMMQRRNIIPEDYESLLQLDEANGLGSGTGQGQSRGLSAADISMLPTQTGNGSGPVEQCCICMEDMNSTDCITRLPACLHTYHSACISKWLKTNASCPIDKSRVELPE